MHYVAEAYKHYKPIVADLGAAPLLEQAGLNVDGSGDEVGVLLATDAVTSRALPARLVAALLQHRFFNRADAADMPA